MDPISNPTPTPNPNPTPTPNPTPAPSPVSPVTPATGTPATAAAQSATQLVSNPASTTSNPISADSVTSGVQTGDFSSLSGGGATTSNPAINMAPVNPVVQPSGNEPVPPINPIIRPSGFDVTDPIMMPDKPQAPDPVEEELRAPMKAAAPVPGSIGSAVSGPAAANSAVSEVPTTNDGAFADNSAPRAQSVSFNDPAMQSEANKPNQTSKNSKSNKITLIALIAVAAVIVVVLVVILIMQLTSGSASSSNASNSSVADGSSTETNPVENDSNGSSDMEVPVDNSSAVAPLSCTYSQEGEDGSFSNNIVVFAIQDNVMGEVTTTRESVAADGTAEDVSTVQTFAEFVTSNTGDVTAMEAYVGTDGAIKLSLEELGAQVQNLLNKDGVTYTCTVNN